MRVCVYAFVCTHVRVYVCEHAFIMCVCVSVCVRACVYSIMSAYRERESLQIVFYMDDCQTSKESITDQNNNCCQPIIR